MRLIDADELIVFEVHIDGKRKGMRFVPAEFIENAPTIKAAPVCRARWEEPIDIVTYRCSECSKYTVQPYGLHEVIFYDYCPKCGAKMNAEEGAEP